MPSLNCSNDISEKRPGTYLATIRTLGLLLTLFGVKIFLTVLQSDIVYTVVRTSGCISGRRDAATVVSVGNKIGEREPLRAEIGKSILHEEG